MRIEQTVVLVNEGGNGLVAATVRRAWDSRKKLH